MPEAAAPDAPARSDQDILRPCRGGQDRSSSFHGLRSLEDSLAPPVATARGPFGAVSACERLG
jgi:hypothetical protein